MKVKLVAITEPEDKSISVADFVAYVARVSNPGNQYNTLTASKLLRYLIDHDHVSPFEMVNMVFEVETTRDIARQILRHSSMKFQEFSQRYANPIDDLGFEIREARLQDKKNRQNSIPTEDKTILNTWRVIQQKCIEQTIIDYNWAIEHGIAKEVARAILPEGLTLSRLYCNINLRTAITYCKLRKSNGTQREHMVIADEIWRITEERFPALKGVVGWSDIQKEEMEKYIDTSPEPTYSLIEELRENGLIEGLDR